ncbi:MAG TPA: hypothetical protein VJN43_20840 [Bryobacteraceae bacterium]|nr:hypothetical protein [Bryobacteraceae bacterium]
MRSRPKWRLFYFGVRFLKAGRNWVVVTAFFAAPAVGQPAREPYLFDSNPTHIWNRLHAALYERSDADGHGYGRDELDPLLWAQTRYLISGPSRDAAIRVMDEFLSGQAERLIRDPIKRAILQRDLWAVFDWLAERSGVNGGASRELETRIAAIMRRVALSEAEIRALQDNYAAAMGSRKFAERYDGAHRAQPFLPPDLFAPAGQWVPLGTQDGEPVALSHLYEVKGHSAFQVFLNLPGGRNETLEYLKKLSEYPRHWRFNAERRGPDDPELIPNPDVPQFPPGTQVALVRRMMLVDDQGRPAVTGVTESVQIRVYRAIAEEAPPGTRRADRFQDGVEFRLSRAQLLRNQPGGLRAVEPGEKQFPVLFSHGFDLFEMKPEDGPIGRHLLPVLQSCTQCHQHAGILSMLSYTGSFSGPRFSHPARLVEASAAEEGRRIVWRKRERYDWGLLEGLWRARP